MLAEILIVEDEVLIAMGIQEKLEGFGYQVSGIASSAQEALKKVMEHPPDLVLMDIVLEGEMDGVDTANKIREQLNLPVIYLTAYDDEKTLKRAKLTKPSAYLLKPFNDRELQITIELALYKEQVRKKLENQENWYASILKCVGDALITVDKTLTILFANPAAEALFNRPSSDLIGHQFSELCLLENQNQETVEVHELVTKAFTEGKRIQHSDLEFMQEKEGVSVDMSVSPIHGDDCIRGGVIIFYERSATSSGLANKKTKKQENMPSRDLLTYREQQVLHYLVEGQATKQLADTLGISPRTVEFHRYNLMRKLGVEDIPSLVRRALTCNLVDLE